MPAIGILHGWEGWQVGKNCHLESATCPKCGLDQTVRVLHTKPEISRIWSCDGCAAIMKKWPTDFAEADPLPTPAMPTEAVFLEKKPPANSTGEAIAPPVAGCSSATNAENSATGRPIAARVGEATGSPSGSKPPFFEPKICQNHATRFVHFFRD